MAQMQGALADLLREIGRMDRRLDALQAVETDTAGGGGGSGTVTSVALALPAILTVSGSPVTTAGTLTAVLATQAANLVWAGPTSGGAAAPTFRALVAADLPAGIGTVTSVGLSLPAILTVIGSPVTTNGTLTATLATQAANLVWAGPTSGGAAAPTFRALVALDMAASVTGTAGAIAKFTATNVVGNSIITESGAAISAAGTFTIVGQSDTNQLVIKGHSTQTSGQIVIQTSAAAELARIYVLANYSMGFGYQAGAVNTAANNMFIGYQAGKVNVGGDKNIGLGAGALALNISGSSLTAIGYNTLTKCTASENLAIGASALSNCTTGYYNVAIGVNALSTLSTSTGNLAIGQSALNQTTGADNVAIGKDAGYWTSSGNANTYVGGAAGSLQSTGSDNVCIGYYAGRNPSALTPMSSSVNIGRETNTGGATGAVTIGHNAGKVVTGNGNVMIGYQAGLLATSGTNNTIIGYQAGASLTANGGCVMIGYQAGNAETTANKLYIANSSTTTPLIYGDFSAPSLTFNGAITVQDARNISTGTTTGTIMATTTAQKLAFHGATAVIQRAGAAQAAVATTAATNTTPYGYTTAAQADAIVALVNEIRATLVEKGIMKGAA